MRLVDLSHRLTKIKGILVSVGVCALTNVIVYGGYTVGGAALSLVFSLAANATGAYGTAAARAYMRRSSTAFPMGGLDRASAHPT